MVFRHFGLCQHEHFGIHFFQLASCLFPEIGRDLFSYIAAVSIDSKFAHPILQCVRHGVVQSRLASVFPVELGHVPPIGARGRLQVARFIEQEVLQVRFGPFAVECRVVCHPIEDHLHAQCMSCLGQCAQVRFGTEVRVDLVVILHAVRASHAGRAGLHHVVVLVFSAFAVDLPNGMDGHEPQNVHTELFQAGQVFCKCIEGPFRGVLPHIHFINGRIGGPSRVR